MMRRHIGWIMTGLVLALFFIGQARAQTYLHWDSNGNIIGSSSQAQVDQLGRDISAYNRARSAGAVSSVSVSGGIASVERAATLEVGAGSGLGTAVKVAVKDVVRSPLASIGKGIVGVARLTPGGIVGTVAGTILLDAGISYLNGQWVKTQPQLGSSANPTCADFKKLEEKQGWYYSGGGNAKRWGLYIAAVAPPGTLPLPAGFDRGNYAAIGYCFNGGDSFNLFWFPQTVQNPPPANTAPATDDEMSKAISDGLSAKPQMAADVVKNIYDNGGWVPVDALDKATFDIGTPTVQGKPSTSTSHTTGPGGTSYTTTKTTTPTMALGSNGDTVGSNTVTWNVTNNTTTTVRNDTTGETTTTTDQETPDVKFSDSAMPELPNLYTQKYPDGLAGVWRDNKPDISNTAFYNGVKTMFPTFGAGQCPVWRMSFNLGAAGNFGTGDLTVPCWIFQALGLVILATAAFTARKIIF